MARTLVADLFTPEVATEYAFSEFTERLMLLQMAMSGTAGSPVRVVPPEQLTEEGARLIIPFFKRISGLVTRRDLTSIAAPTPLKLEGGTRGIVMMRGKIGPLEISLDSAKVTRADQAAINAEIGRQAGQEMMKFVQESIFRIIIASLGITIGGESHIFDAYEPFNATLSTSTVVNNTISLGLLNSGKRQLDDFSDQLSLMIMRNEIAADLVDQNLAQGLDTIAGYTALTGLVRTLGLGNPLVMDNLLLSASNPSGSRQGSGTGSSPPDVSLSGNSHDLFRTLMLGPDMSQLTFPHNLEMFQEGPKLEAEAPFIRILGQFDWGFGIRGVGYKSGSPDNPTSAQQADSSNYEDVTTGGHKEVLAAIIESNQRADAN